MIITAAQLRAARGILDWTRTDLAKAANISPETVKNIEHGTFRPQEQTADAIIRAFGAYDVIFTENEGVQIRRDTVTRYEGTEGFKKLMDDIYKVASDLSGSDKGDGQKSICVSNVDDRLFMKHLGDYMLFHAKRMNELKNIKVRVLVKEEDNFTIPGGSYLEYRWTQKQASGDVPFYVFGDKFAIIIFNEKTGPQIVVISSDLVSKAYREQFDLLWQNAKPPKKSIEKAIAGKDRL